eukprot:COSAG04_NODE_2342_length_4295_cov_168.358913_3_plen_32_part_00
MGFDYEDESDYDNNWSDLVEVDKLDDSLDDD